MSVTVLSNRHPLPLGIPVVYYNHWTGFETDRFKDQFTGLSGTEVSKLTPGTTIFKDVDPLHPHGKVYGYLKAMVTGVTILGNNVLVEYTFGGESGNLKRVQLNATRTGFLLAKNEEELAALLAEMPQATVV